MPRLILALGLALTLAACGAKTAGADDLAAGQAYLATNAKQPGVITLASGLQYKIVHSGPATGQTPSAEDEVRVNYEGKLLNGKVFDSSFARGVPAEFQVGGLIPAWVQALQMMKPGDEWILYVPASLAYGEQGAGEDIPPNATLVFRIQLLGVLNKGAMG
jgi:FKBP-type peptidyl-prolyl cis-trans isomerase